METAFPTFCRQQHSSVDATDERSTRGLRQAKSQEKPLLFVRCSCEHGRRYLLRAELGLPAPPENRHSRAAGN